MMILMELPADLDANFAIWHKQNFAKKATNKQKKIKCVLKTPFFVWFYGQGDVLSISCSF